MNLKPRNLVGQDPQPGDRLCECENVTRSGDTWACIRCSRRFIPPELCGSCSQADAGPQRQALPCDLEAGRRAA